MEKNIIKTTDPYLAQCIKYLADTLGEIKVTEDINLETFKELTTIIELHNGGFKTPIEMTDGRIGDGRYSDLEWAALVHQQMRIADNYDLYGFEEARVAFKDFKKRWPALYELFELFAWG